MVRSPIRVLLVEDDPDLLDVIDTALRRETDINVVAKFSTGAAFLDGFLKKEADVVVMDIGLPDHSGIDLVAKAKPLKPQVQFLMCTIFENPAYTFQALCAGATGYLTKNAGQERMAEAIRELHAGGSPMSPAIARMVVGSFQGQVKQRIQDQSLTDREKNILDQLAQGLMYKEIAAKAFISVDTVRTHVRNIYDKLQVNSRMEAIRKVYPHGNT